MFSHIVDKHTFAEFPQQNVFSHCGQTHFWRISPTKCFLTLWTNTLLQNFPNKMFSHIVDKHTFEEFPQQNVFSHCGWTHVWWIYSTKCVLTLWTTKLCRIYSTKCVLTLWTYKLLLNFPNKICSHIVDEQAFIEFPQQNVFSHCGRTSFCWISHNKTVAWSVTGWGWEAGGWPARLSAWMTGRIGRRFHSRLAD